MIIKTIRILFKFSYPYTLDLRDMIRILKDLSYVISDNLPLTPPGSMILGSVTALKDDLIIEFNNITGTISFFIQSLDKIDLVEEDLRRIVGNLNLGKIDYIELSLEIIFTGKLNLNLNMLGGEVVGLEVSSEKKNVRINSYMAMTNSYSVLITYKLNEIKELDNITKEIKRDIQELENKGLR
ncbi:MAG: hypothetical protein RXQ99_09230 [Acidianus sp.]